MAKKHKHEEHENHERWVVSYADFMTLLFAFFVVMYASSKVDKQKIAETTKSMRWALSFKGNGGVTPLAIFKGPPTEGGCTMAAGPTPQAMHVQVQAMEQMRKRMERTLRPFVLESSKNRPVNMAVENGRLKLRLAADHFFDPTSASLRPEALAVLDAIAAELVDAKQNVRIEGHTDDEQSRASRFASNWDLSASRASTVVDYLEQAHNIDSKRLTAAGLGSSKPLVSNDTPAHRDLNRRIEFVLELAPQYPQGSAPPAN